VTFTVLPRETPQERAAARDELAKGVAEGNRDALRVALGQARSGDAVAVALQQMAEKGTGTRPALVSDLTYEERQRRYEEWEAQNGYTRDGVKP
jgi:hypothetical protein